MSVTSEVVLEEAPAPSGVGLRRRLRRLDGTGKVALGVLAVVLLISFLGPWLSAGDPVRAVGAPFQHPGDGALLGTDELGLDIATRILHGARQSWIGALLVIASGILIGTTVGLIAGARGGWVDTVLMRVTDAFLSLPAPVLALAIAAALGRSYTNTLIGVAIVWWPLYARIVRADVRAFASRPFVEAAQMAGVPWHRLWLRHLLPGTLPPILIAASLDVSGLVLTVSGLSFLGLGAPQPSPELGAMTAQGLPYLLTSPWVALFPAAAIFVIALASNLAGDALRDMLED